MVFPDQALDIHRPQRDLVALRLTQPRSAERRRFRLRLRLLRQLSKQFIGSHHLLHESIIARESHCVSYRLDCWLSPPKKITLSEERPLGRVSKDDAFISWFETAQERL